MLRDLCPPYSRASASQILLLEFPTVTELVQGLVGRRIGMSRLVAFAAFAVVLLREAGQRIKAFVGNSKFAIELESDSIRKDAAI